jgi:hypothetical protein
MDIEEGEEVQAEGICNMFNKIIAENFPNLKKEMSIQYRRSPDGHEQNRTSPCHAIFKTMSTENKERRL